MSLICPICQENLINKESPDNFVNKCGHVYHSNCILPWWDRTPEPTCPQCREPCNINTITKIYLTVDDTQVNSDSQKPTPIAIDDPKAELLLRQIREHVEVQTYNQTKDLNEKFRQQNSEFSAMLLNNITRLKSNYEDKLTAVSSELSTAITSEHKRLLTALDLPERQDNESCLADEPRPAKRRKRFIHPIAGVTCFIAVVTLIIVVIYSHLILNALHTNANSGSLNINNISQRLDVLNGELHAIATNSTRDYKNLRLALDGVNKAMGNGARNQDIVKRLDDVSHRGDQLLLEQIQTDRRINLKLEALENSINILKTRIEADGMSASQAKDEKQAQLEELNRQIEAKLRRLKSIMDKSSNATPEELRRIIENDSELAPEQSASVWEDALEQWNKLVHSDSSRSSSNAECSVRVLLVVACTAITFLFRFGSI